MPSTASSRTGRRILIVDDDETTRATFRHMLVAEGFEVAAAATVDAVFAYTGADVPDAILLDLHMPIANGLDCLRRMRASSDWSAVPVAIITGDYFVGEEVARELAGLGARIQFKPVWHDDLCRIVRELLSLPVAAVHGPPHH